MAVGLQARDHVLTGFDRADLVIAVGYDLVEYAPGALEPGRTQADHPHRHPAGRGGRRLPARGRAHRRHRRTLRRLLAAVLPGGVGGRDARRPPRSARDAGPPGPADRAAGRSAARSRPTTAGRSRPQKAIADLRRALGPEDIVVSDVGAHKIWVARLYQAYEPNTVIISNGFAAMGIALPGAIAAKLVHPDRRVVALCGDGGFLMNSQELETARRIGANVTVVVWRDDGYGLIDWKQRSEFGRPFGVEFDEPGLRRLRPVLRHRRLPALIGGRPLSDPDARPRARRPVGRRRADRLRARTCGSPNDSAASRTRARTHGPSWRAATSPLVSLRWSASRYSRVKIT